MPATLQPSVPHAPMHLPPVLTEIAAASLAAATESAPCPPLWRCGPCDYSTASAAEYTRHTGDQAHMGRIARARLALFRTPVPAPTNADGWQDGGRYEASAFVWDADAKAWSPEALRFFAELRDLRHAGCSIRPFAIHETGTLQIEFRRVARPRPVPPDVGDAVHEWAEAADAEQAHESAVAHGGA